jgi:hypothetical protein
MMRIFLWTVVVAAWLWCSSFALAGFTDGNTLFRRCSGAGGVDFGFCFGYIDAITDVLYGGNFVNGYNACVPAGVEANQLKDVVVQFLRLNPSRRHLVV